MSKEIKEVQAQIGGTRPREITPEGAQTPLLWRKAVVLHPPQRMNAHDHMAAHVLMREPRQKAPFSQTPRNRGV